MPATFNWSKGSTKHKMPNQPRAGAPYRLSGAGQRPVSARSGVPASGSRGGGGSLDLVALSSETLSAACPRSEERSGSTHPSSLPRHHHALSSASAGGPGAPQQLGYASPSKPRSPPPLRFDEPFEEHPAASELLNPRSPPPLRFDEPFQEHPSTSELLFSRSPEAGSLPHLRTPLHPRGWPDAAETEDSGLHFGSALSPFTGGGIKTVGGARRGSELFREQGHMSFDFPPAPANPLISAAEDDPMRQQRASSHTSSWERAARPDHSAASSSFAARLFDVDLHGEGEAVVPARRASQHLLFDEPQYPDGHDASMGFSLPLGGGRGGGFGGSAIALRGGIQPSQADTLVTHEIEHRSGPGLALRPHARASPTAFAGEIHPSPADTACMPADTGASLLKRDVRASIPDGRLPDSSIPAPAAPSLFPPRVGSYPSPVSKEAGGDSEPGGGSLDQLVDHQYGSFLVQDANGIANGGARRDARTQTYPPPSQDAATQTEEPASTSRRTPHQYQRWRLWQPGKPAYRSLYKKRLAANARALLAQARALPR
ncbi:hypothetical protein EMIHUDRAFT_98097 [Emiliania huxleyi CCMP1516]|uniref:Uncharacterized protein n=2 Tax=Emiliania huxleyi TaxID=2903 RepID=A0A0D3KJG4_EMIH1|nr:hypothetical protein EMIHUDRAFT_122602 [Emiliania huxleyi CCMP1516]XP_005790669.1 hypothetical protein EMIHUDRAFT_98097 [Emiliania huxleyi CCMP1516]EOD35899.1 hypothetical protein EMIHUDRAFT_122602 [Emiliania huxleyi CCMP1516]EOD38240.1 hypothetical protein EMIHUDRAFT_98097 [Emiliania huxleyi CCMP1516]|eukprot:XP_005788328.1 hypothetical protein EMIHUDRAFT_122602 [Emiliania huxleyi CCMP1516]